MYGVSPEFLEQLKKPSRQWRSRLDILSSDEVVQQIDRAVLDGKVTVDNTAVRRTADITILDTDGTLTPRYATDLLAPKGTEIRPWRGLWTGARYEYIPLGTFGITSLRIGRGAGGGVKISITGDDRAAAIRERVFSEPYTVADGTYSAIAIREIFDSRGVNFDKAITSLQTQTTELHYDVGDDPWAAIQDIAQAAGQYAAFTPKGMFVVRDNSRPTETGLRYSTGNETSLVLDIERHMDSDEIYSGVIVDVQHPNRDPYRVTVWDTNKASPTYYLGPFGKRPLVITSSTIRSPAQADRLANSLMRGVVAGFGTAIVRQRQTASLSIAGNPGHEVGDAIRINDQATGTVGRWIVTGAEIPVRTGPVTLNLIEGMYDRPEHLKDAPGSSPVTVTPAGFALEDS